MAFPIIHLINADAVVYLAVVLIVSSQNMSHGHKLG